MSQPNFGSNPPSPMSSPQYNEQQHLLQQGSWQVATMPPRDRSRQMQRLPGKAPGAESFSQQM